MFTKLYSPFDLLIGFHLFDLVDNVKMHEHLLEMVVCENLCIPFDGNKMSDVKEPFLGFFPLEQWGVEKWDIADVTFAYLNITSAIFQPNPCNHLAGYRAHIQI